jgi:hypothetical protein
LQIRASGTIVSPLRASGLGSVFYRRLHLRLITCCPNGQTFERLMLSLRQLISERAGLSEEIRASEEVDFRLFYN